MPRKALRIKGGFRIKEDMNRRLELVKLDGLAKSRRDV